MHRFVLFVDGSNLMGSLKHLGVTIDDYEPFYRDIFDRAVEAWRGTCNSPVPEPAQLRRVYWYVVGFIDEWDLSNQRTQEHLKKQFDSDRSIKNPFMEDAGKKLAGKSQQNIAEEAWTMCLGELGEWYRRKHQSLDGMKRFYHGVRTDTDFIDICDVGHWKVNMLNRSVSEKGIDTSLAVDMVALEDNYDVAVVVSGDWDTIPSINYMKTRNKHVGVVEFHKGYPPEKKGRQFSSALKRAADFVVHVYEMDLTRQGIANKGDIDATSTLATEAESR